jgi:MarR family transcriptional regulator, organic hydroperoxide resistance regulator
MADLRLEEEVGFALVVAARNVLAVYRPVLEPLGLTHPQFLVMVCLWQYGPLMVKDLGKHLWLDSGTLSPLLKRLETMGMVVRRRADDDERVVVVILTEQGQALRTAAEQVPEAIRAELGMPVDDVQDLHSVLSRLTR